MLLPGHLGALFDSSLPLSCSDCSVNLALGVSFLQAYPDPAARQVPARAVTKIKHIPTWALNSAIVRHLHTCRENRTLKYNQALPEQLGAFRNSRIPLMFPIPRVPTTLIHHGRVGHAGHPIKDEQSRLCHTDGS